MQNFFCNKKTLGIVMLVIVIHLLLAYASFGPTVTSELNEIPIGFINSDQGVGDENLGLILEQEIQGADSEEIKWIQYDSISAMYEALDEKVIYGSLVLPPDLTESVFTLQSERPRQAIVEVVLNEGMNTTGANTVQSIITGIINEMNREIRNDMLGSMQQMDLQLKPEQAAALTEPLIIQTSISHPVGEQARGHLPLMFTVLLWLGSLIGSLSIWLLLHRKNQIASEFVGTQILSGIALAIIQAFSTMVVIGWLMGIELVNYGYLIMFLILTAFVFFLIQSSVLNWLGFKGWPLLIMVWLFGLPVASLPPEFLSPFYRLAIYSWIPFRFSVEGLSSIMFFDTGGNLSSMLAVLSVMGAVFLLILLSSYTKLKNQDLSISPFEKRVQNVIGDQVNDKDNDVLHIKDDYSRQPSNLDKYRDLRNNQPEVTRYEGQWKMGKPHGKGTIFYNNGTAYRGEFYEGKRHGNGTFVKTTGERIRGNWENDQIAL